MYIKGKEVNADNIIQYFEELKGSRTNWESIWQEVTDYCRPVRSDVYNFDSAFTNGDDRSNRQFDNTAIQAIEKFASGIYGYMCRPDEVWFNITPLHEEIKNDEECSRWFAEATNILFRNLYLSNFAQEIHEDFLDLGSYGVSNMYIEAGKETPFRFKNIPISHYVIDESSDNVVDTVIYKFKMTVKQLIQEFGIDNVSMKCRKVFEKGNAKDFNKKFEVIHVVCPRINRKGKIGKKNMPYASIYIEVESKHILRNGGYETMPYVVARFLKDPEELYGRSPAINSMSDIKMLNAMNEILLKTEEKVLNPPILAAHNSIMNKPDFSAGNIIYIRGSVFQDRPVPLETAKNVRVGIEMLERLTNKIKESFYTDMFDYLVGGKYMTATEVDARKQTKLFLIAPLLARVQNEKLTRIIERCFAILLEKGMFPEMPELLYQYPDYEIKFIGRMSDALKSIETNATQQVLMMLQPMMQYNPDVSMNFDWNTLIRDIGMNNGMPVKYIRPKEEVEAEIQQRNQMQMMQAQAQMASNGAKAAKELNEPVVPNSMLQQVTGAE